ncbi:ribonuclease H-like domain-containing protein [Tanacetum coccineum]
MANTRRLPSSVLAGKSPFSMLYGREPSLSHLRCFGCLCFSSVLNNSDKFSSKSEKCILIGYFSSKKAYKLLSLENRSYIFSRDVKFYETIFPYKMNSDKKSFENVINNEVNNKNFFDLFESGQQKISRPNDDGQGPSDDAGEVIVDHRSTDTAKEQSFDDDVHTASSMDDNPISEGNVPSVQNVPTYDSSNKTDDDNLVFVNTRRSRNNNDEISKFKILLNQKFKIKDLGELKFFLGIKVLKIKNGLCLNQRKYCIELLHDYGLLVCKPVATPMPENGTLSHKETKKDKLLKNITSYQKIVGKLIYLCNTIPDIAYSVHCLSQHMHSPLQSHFEAALRVLRYLKFAPGAGIVYTKSSLSSISAYADSDWAKCKMTRRSVSGYCVFVCGGLVSWKSKKQATLSRSFVEAEYRSMASAVCEVMWIVKILKDLKFSSSILASLFCDNSSAIQIAANPVMHEKTKHFDIDVHLIREKVASGLIKTVKVDSEKQIADILTKDDDDDEDMPTQIAENQVLVLDYSLIGESESESDED